jgi:aquaporin Z
MREAAGRHWREYLIEAGGLGLFMMSAAGFATLLYHPGSPAAGLADPFPRRCLMGLAMGLTAVALIFSPWGQRSGAHFNPATTLTFYRLGKVAGPDAAGYIAAQFVGGAAGMLLVTAVIGKALGHPEVNYVVTGPGFPGAGVAFAAEVLISFGLMTTVLTVSNIPGLARFAGLFAGALVAIYITVEAPVSGMSMNPARSFASALAARLWTGFWIYLTAPPLGMLLAAQVHLWRGGAPVRCAKLHHENAQPCIFRCGHAPARPSAAPSRAPTRASLPVPSAGD